MAIGNWQNKLEFFPNKTRTLDLITILIGFSIAFALFIFGINAPTTSRIIGDAREYLEISSQFKTASEALTYVGERASGMPIFNWLFKPNESSDITPGSLWILLICAGLFVTHLMASFVGVGLLEKLNLTKNRNSLRFAFIFICSFPAFIGHTTTPLTDTLAVDLTLFNLALLVFSEKKTMPKKASLIALFGLFSAYTCLLRPAYLYATIAAMTVFALFSLFKKKFISLIGPVLFAVVLISVGEKCKTVYGKMCLQNPQTFQAIYHAHMGLRGGRLLWGGPYYSDDEFPILPDSILKPEYYDRCNLDRFIGTETNSLTGCLASRPQFIPAYIIKKWIGLFDHFRFQPYMEGDTPDWLRWLSRSYDVLAWIGFLVMVLTISRSVLSWKWIWNLHEAVLAYIVFLGLMLAEHTILHPEDRFGLVLIPISMAGFILFAEKIKELIHSKKWKMTFVSLTIAFSAALLFLWQIVAWDQTHF